MAGSLSNIGLGSNGALSYDIIEKLRDVDNKNQIDPIDRRLKTNSTKLLDLSLLTTMTATFKGATSALSNEMSYLKRSDSVSGSSIEINTLAGTSVQDFTIDVSKLAARDIIESKSFLSETTTFTNAADTININIDGKDYTIDVDSSTTLTQLKDDIFDKTDGKVTASILNVGGIEPYKLILKSTDTGADQNITVTSAGTAIADLALNDLDKAQDAQFKFNGIDILRATNEFDDLVVGVTIKLKENGISNVSIKQDTSDIVSNLETFVAKYNELVSNLDEATKYDRDSGASGTFQGVSEIISMKSMINKQLLTMDKDGRDLTDYGLTLNSTGMLELDKTTIEDKLSTDSKDVESFFRGLTTANTTTKLGSAVSAGSIDVLAGQFSINGTDVVVNLTGTSSENALALKSAINNANITGIEAFLNNTGTAVTLKSTSGKDIEIAGDSDKLSLLGFSAGTTEGTSETTTGIFTTFNDKLYDLISKKDSTLKLFEESLNAEKKSLQQNRIDTVKKLDSKYDIMATKFRAYDSIIGKLNSQFQALSMMIEASYADKK